MHKFGHFLKIIAIVLVSLAVAVVSVSQSSKVQSMIASRLIDSVSEDIDGTISVGKMHFLLNTLIIKDAIIIDSNPSPYAQSDTLAKIDYIAAKITPRTIADFYHHEKGEDVPLINIDRVRIKGLTFNYFIDSYTKTDNLRNIFRIEPKEQTSNDKRQKLYISRFKLEDGVYTMVNHRDRKPLSPLAPSLDYDDLYLEDVNISAGNLSFADMIFECEDAKISAKDHRSGLRVDLLSSEYVRVGQGLTDLQKLRLKDCWSDTKVEVYQMHYDKAADFQDYIHKVKMVGKFNKSRINLRSISFFAVGFTKLGFDTILDGEASGALSDFFVDINAQACKNGGEPLMSAKVKGTFDIDEKIEDMSLNANLIARSINSEKFAELFDIENIATFAPGMDFDGDIHLKGSHEKLLADIKIFQEGNNFSRPLLALVATGHNLMSKDEIEIEMKVGTDNLDLGKALGINNLGKVSANIDASGTMSDISLYDLTVDRLDFGGYSYSGISAMGHLEEQSLFEGQISVDDPSVQFSFDGLVGYIPKENGKFSLSDLLYNFSVAIPKVDLKAINLNISDQISSIAVASLEAEKDRAEDGYSSRIMVDGIEVVDHEGPRNFGSAIYTVESSQGDYTAILSSKIADAVLSGSLEDAISDVSNAIISRHFPKSVARYPYRETLENEYKLSATLKDISPLLGYFVEGIYIEKGTSLEATLDADNNFALDLRSRRLALKANNLKNIRVRMKSDEHGVIANIFGNSLNLAGYNLKNDFITFAARKDTLDFSAGFRNNEESYGELAATSSLKRLKDGQIGADILVSDSFLRNPYDMWEIHPSHISINPQDFAIDNLLITSLKGDRIKLQGRKSGDIKMDIGCFDLGALTRRAGVSLGGKLEGKANLKLLMDDENFFDADMNIENAIVDRIEIGKVMLTGYFNKGEKLIEVSLRNTSQGNIPFWTQGTYSLMTQELDGQIFFNNFNVDEISPFVTKFVTDLQGQIDGYALISKTQNGNLSVSSDSHLDIKDVSCKVVPTGVGYTANGSIQGSYENIVTLNNFILKDMYGGTATLTGSLDINDINNIVVDADALVKNIECINIPYTGNETFSGNVFADCKAHVSGPLTALNIEGEAAISGPSNVELSLWGNTSKSANSMLTFKSIEDETEEDAYEQMLSKLNNAKNKARNALTANLVLKATDDLVAKASFMEGGTSSVNMRGNGDISLNVDSSKGTFDTHGDYIISEGKCHVDLAVVREFTIDEGSAIHINTPITTSDLDLRAIYKTKTNVSTLISDTTSVGQRRNVNCIINVTDKIADPKIDLAIEIPDLDATVKSQVESALNTEDKIQRQFVALLISNSFMPTEESGIVNNSTLVFSNASQILANQFNKMLGKFDIPIDLGLNYQPSQTGGRDIFDVAFSTQLFNNRVEVGGQISNSNYQSTTTGTESLLGDLDVEVKVDKKGSLRVKGFSHSADKYTIYLDDSQRNGIGVSYQKDFDTFKDFWYDLWNRKKK